MTHDLSVSGHSPITLQHTPVHAATLCVYFKMICVYVAIGRSVVLNQCASAGLSGEANAILLI